jgi:hypothetical protein
MIGNLEQTHVGLMQRQRDAVLLDDVDVGPDVIDMTVGVEQDDGLELERGDGRHDLLVVGAGIDHGAGAGLFAVDEVTVRLESPDDDQLVFHDRTPGAILSSNLDPSQPRGPRRQHRARAAAARRRVRAAAK